jgi:hypothetical protein
VTSSTARRIIYAKCRVQIAVLFLKAAHGPLITLTEDLRILKETGTWIVPHDPQVWKTNLHPPATAIASGSPDIVEDSDAAASDDTADSNSDGNSDAGKKKSKKGKGKAKAKPAKAKAQGKKKPSLLEQSGGTVARLQMLISAWDKERDYHDFSMRFAEHLWQRAFSIAQIKPVDKKNTARNLIPLMSAIVVLEQANGYRESMLAGGAGQMRWDVKAVLQEVAKPKVIRSGQPASTSTPRPLWAFVDGLLPTSRPDVSVPTPAARARRESIKRHWKQIQGIANICRDADFAHVRPGVVQRDIAATANHLIALFKSRFEATYDLDEAAQPKLKMFDYDQGDEVSCRMWLYLTRTRDLTSARTARTESLAVRADVRPRVRANPLPRRTELVHRTLVSKATRLLAAVPKTTASPRAVVKGARRSR